MAKQTARGRSTSTKGCSIPRGWRGRRQSAQSQLSYKPGEGQPASRHRRLPADRQFRIDARPADFGRRDERGYSRAHAGTLWRQGRDPRFHHARLEGRPVHARNGSPDGKAGQPRPAQRPAPHHLQIGRRAVAARAQEPWPDAARGTAEGEHRRRGLLVGPRTGCLPGPSSGAS